MVGAVGLVVTIATSWPRHASEEPEPATPAAAPVGGVTCPRCGAYVAFDTACICGWSPITSLVVQGADPDEVAEVTAKLTTEVRRRQPHLHWLRRLGGGL